MVTRTNTLMTRADKNVGIKSVAVPEARLEFPTDGKGRFWIHFSPHDPARFVSAVDVLEGRMPADRVAQRLVLIGTSAIGLLDLKTTPIDPAMPGVEVHAQILESVLTNATLSAPLLGQCRGTRGCVRHRRGSHHSRADARTGLAAAVRRGDRVRADRNVLVLLHAGKTADRFHLPAAVEPR